MGDDTKLPLTREQIDELIMQYGQVPLYIQARAALDLADEVKRVREDAANKVGDLIAMIQSRLDSWPLDSFPRVALDEIVLSAEVVQRQILTAEPDRG